MKRECNHKMITLGVTPLEFYPDDEPYQAGKSEDVSEEHKDMIDTIECYVSANICTKCGKVYLYESEGITLVCRDDEGVLDE